VNGKPPEDSPASKVWYASAVILTVDGPNRAQVEALARRAKRCLDTETNQLLRTAAVKRNNVCFSIRWHERAWEGICLK